MDRKHFFRAFIPASLAALSVKQAFSSPIGEGKSANQPFSSTNIPRYLQEGDTVAITCPAGPVELEKLAPCIRSLRNWGLKVVFGKTVGKKWQRFGGTDPERLIDFQQLLDDPNISAIIFGKGGYGTMRIIDGLNWEKFQQDPKWLVGYSDLTVVHMHVHSNLNIPTIHGDMGNGFSIEDESCVSLYNTLFGHKVLFELPSSVMNRTGKATGKIVGGNLTLVHACAASKSDIDTTGKILFLEDVSEYKYSIDRMMMALKRSGKLDHLAGLILGQFTAVKQEQEETFNMRIEDIIWDKVKNYNYPVCFNFPAGHIADNRAFKMGIPYNLAVGREWVTLAEAEIPRYGHDLEVVQDSKTDSNSFASADNLRDSTIRRR